jgi:hypothetical protein
MCRVEKGGARWERDVGVGADSSYRLIGGSRNELDSD